MRRFWAWFRKLCESMLGAADYEQEIHKVSDRMKG